MAFDWSPGMSDTLQLYYNASRTAWHQHITTNQSKASGWHFCFVRPAVSPASTFPFYGWGDVSNTLAPSLVAGNGTGTAEAKTWPNTEQFASGCWLPAKPIRLLHARGESSLNSTFNGDAVFVDEHGRLHVVSFLAPFFGGSLSNEFARPGINGLGLGPKPKDAIDSLPSNIAFAGYNVQSFRLFPTRVYGDAPEFEQVKFIKCGITYGNKPTGFGRDGRVTIRSALSDQGTIWMTGAAGHFAQSSEFVENTTELAYFRETFDYDYETPEGSQSDEAPLAFVDYNHGYNNSMFPLMVALTADGRMFICGRYQYLGDTPSVVNTEGGDGDGYSPIFREVTGFIDLIELTSGGSGYVPGGAAVSVASTRTHTGYPTQDATFSVGLSGSQVVSVLIDNAGYGYTGTSTVTFSQSPSGSGAEATATAFERKWASLDRGICCTAAICENGILYQFATTRPLALGANPGALQSGAALRAPRRVANQNASGYSQVATGDGFGIALRNDGKIETWGEANKTPTLSGQFKLTELTEEGTFVAVAAGRGFGAALRDDGKIFTYGSNLQGALGRGFSGSPSANPLHFAWGQVVGDAEWSDIFACPFSMFANRANEQFDEYGNRSNPLPPYSP
jgi:hypothetical protein